MNVAALVSRNAGGPVPAAVTQPELGCKTL
jgi:hypothetical protein